MNQRKGFLSCNNFDANDFRKPPIEYAPIYSWMWDDIVSEEVTDRRLQEMLRLGIKRFYIIPIPKEFRGRSLPSEMYPEYLTDKYFAQYRYAIKRAAELGMQIWLYDEGGWPSGSACGRVLSESDGYARESVEIKTYRLHSGETYLPDPDVVATFANGCRIYKGYIAHSDMELDEYSRKVSVYQGTVEVPDITKAATTDAFLRLTHERYHAVLKEEFGGSITAVFTDEPTGPRPFPYREELSCKFYELYSIHIEDFFPYLFGRIPISEAVALVIIDWYDLCSDYFCRNFLIKEKERCHTYGLTFLGHMDKDDEPNGSLHGGSYNIMRALRCLDVPGVDVIHRQIYPDKRKVEDAQRVRKDGRCTVEKANRFFPRFASSAAAQIGSRSALTESFAVYGDGITFSEMRFVLNYQAIRGINVFNLMALSYGERGPLRTGILPHFSDKYACFSDQKYFNDYCERLSYLASLGRRAVDVALYYPIRDSYIRDFYRNVADHFEEVGEKMEALHVDFDVFDDDVIVSASEECLAKGEIRVGLSVYKTLVFPFCRYVSSSVTEKLQRFIVGGGTVITVSSADGFAIINGSQVVSLSEIEKYLRPAIEFIGECKGFSASRSELQNGELYLIMNENAERASCTVRLPRSITRLIRDISVGDAELIPNGQTTLTLTLDAGEAVCLLSGNMCMDSLSISNVVEVGTIQKWTFRKVEQMLLNKDSVETMTFVEKNYPVLLGDWRRYVGEDFSGSCVYESVFDWDPSRDCLIDLGEVKYSCQLKINGHFLEVKVMSPYRWRVSKSLLKDHNTISVRVTGSCANAFLYSDVFDEDGVSSYYEIEKEYLVDSLSAGLFGEVKLYSFDRKLL